MKEAGTCTELNCSDITTKALGNPTDGGWIWDGPLELPQVGLRDPGLCTAAVTGLGLFFRKRVQLQGRHLSLVYGLGPKGNLLRTVSRCVAASWWPAAGPT